MRKWIPALIIVVCLALWLKDKRVEIGTSTSVAASLANPKNSSDSLSKSSGAGSKFDSNSLSVGENTSAVNPLTDSHISLEEVYCRLVKAGVSVPLGDDLKVVSWQFFSDSSDKPQLLAYVQSSQCPMGFFSKVILDEHGAAVTQIDCRHISAEELALESGIQSEIHYSPSETNHVDLAHSGGGMFVQSCGGEIQYTRDGRFLMTENQTLANRDGCDILDQRGYPLEVDASESFDERGCLSSGRCVAVVQPELDSFRILNRHTYVATGDPEKILLRDPYIFTDSYENLENPKYGVVGPDFEKLPAMQKPVSCAGFK